MTAEGAASTSLSNLQERIGALEQAYAQAARDAARLGYEAIQRGIENLMKAWALAESEAGSGWRNSLESYARACEAALAASSPQAQCEAARAEHVKRSQQLQEAYQTTLADLRTRHEVLLKSAAEQVQQSQRQALRDHLKQTQSLWAELDVEIAVAQVLPRVPGS